MKLERNSELFEDYERVRVWVNMKPIEITDFSGKLVKSFLVCSNRSFEEAFLQEGGLKDLHVTPIFDPRGKPIYPKVLVKCSFCKDEKPKGVKPVKLPSEGFFEVAGPKELIDQLFNYSNCKFRFKGTEIEMETSDVKEVNVQSDYGDAILVKMRGPVVLRDPWHKPGEGLRSRFLPSPSHLFSVNVYSLFKDEYFEVLMEMERALVEDHSSLHSLGKVWYFYDGKWLPALSGTILFWVRESSERVKKVLRHAALFGVGSGRAAGFGDVEIKWI